MDKFLVCNEKEYVALFKDFELEDAERLFHVEFAYENGIFQSDWLKGLEINEDQEVDMSRYRKDEDSNFPEEYPCVVLLTNDSGFDRFGKLKIQLLEFVYLKDFEK